MLRVNVWAETVTASALLRQRAHAQRVRQMIARPSYAHQAGIRGGGRVSSGSGPAAGAKQRRKAASVAP